MLLRLTIVLVCVGSMFMCVSAQRASRSVVLPRDYGVKLCGREFIRAVIFTCGGSRWKRSLDSLEEYLDPLQLSSFSDVTEGGARLHRQYGLQVSAAAEPSPLQLPSSSSSSSSSSSLADLLAMLGGQRDIQESPTNAGPEGSQHAAMLVVGGGERGRGTEKRKRNFSLGVAGMCCNQGCTKNDIGRLC